MSDPIHTLSLPQSLQAVFEANSLQLQLNHAELFALKSAALSRFQHAGFPSKKVEDYRYFPLDGLNKLDLSPALLNPALVGETPAGFENYQKKIHVSNGFPLKFEGIDDLISASNFQQATDDIKQVFVNDIAENQEQDAVYQLNTAFFADALLITIPSNTVIDEPILIVHHTKLGKNEMAFPRQFVHVGANSVVSFVEVFIQNDDSAYTNAVLRVKAEEGAKVNWVKIQNTPNATLLIDNTSASVAKHATFDIFTLCFGAQKLRNNLTISLDSERCDAHLNGFYFPKEGELVDNHTLVDHRFAHCESNEFYKGAIGQGATAIFNGKVFVRPDAQKTNAYQSNKNILLGDNATINTKPQLEIYADDVKCSHGSSTGFIDQDALFYMQSRGISRSSAQALLLSAFALDVVNYIKHEPLRLLVSHWVEQRILN